MTPSRVLPAVLLAVLGLGAAACFRARPAIAPVPPAVESLEGYASWKLTREGGSARSRFAFLIVLPDRALIEITDPLRRTVSRLVLAGPAACLVVPGKRAYWKAERPEVMTRLLGFDISPVELAALLTGRGQGLAGWDLETDDLGRVVGGRRGALTFSAREFFDAGPVPRMVSFDNGAEQGSLKVSRLEFNQPLREGAFALPFLEDGSYRAVGWPEIEKWLLNED